MCVLTLACPGEDAGSDAADVLLADAVVASLWPQSGDAEQVQVPLVGETHQGVLAVVLLDHRAEHSQRHATHTTALMGRQLELGLSTHLGEGEHLGGGGYNRERF